MGDNGDFDLCECIGNHESQMRRLLGMLRQTQAFCSDSSCVDDLSPVPQTDVDPVSSSYMIFGALLLAVVGIFMFALPRRNNEGKGRANFRNDDREPPAIS